MTTNSAIIGDPQKDRRCRAPHPNSSLADAVEVSRFWRLVNAGKPEACWQWLGDVDRNGYGIFFFHGTRRPAHELALSFTTGEVRSPGLDTCHSCDDPRCCNPNHLRFDTRQSNVDDMVRRGRNSVGSAHPSAKLTEQDVLTIRMRRANGARQKDLARDFGISEGEVQGIVYGLRWKHVGGPITNRHIAHTRKAA